MPYLSSRPRAPRLERVFAEHRDAEELQQLRWMVEEFRVSLFAQDLRTVMRVSEQRLAEQLERANTLARG